MTDTTMTFADITTIEEITANVAAIKTVADSLMVTLSAQDSKLNEIRDFIARLTGTTVTPEQLNDLSNIVNDAQALLAQDMEAANANLAKTDSLDDPTPQP